MTPLLRAGGLHHVGIAVPALDDAIRSYRDVLGYEAGDVVEVPEQGVRVVFVTRADSRIELLEPTETGSGVARFIAERGRATLHHLCFEVDDLETALACLAQDGIELIDRVPRQGVDGRVAFLHPRAAGGVLIELLETRR